MTDTAALSNSYEATLTTGGVVAAEADGDGVDPILVGPVRYEPGGEIEVNTITSGDQAAPGFTHLLGGRQVVAWIDQGGAPDGTPALKAQLLDAAGAKIGGEIVVSTDPAGFLGRAFDIVEVPPGFTSWAPGGGFFVAFSEMVDPSDLSAGMTIKGALYDATGDEIFGDLHLSEGGGSNVMPTVTITESGTLAVAWTHLIGGLSSIIEYATFDGSFDRTSGESDVALDWMDSAFFPELAPAGPDEFVLLFKAENQQPGGPLERRISGRFYGPGGEPGETVSIPVAEGDLGRPSATPLADGGLVVVWESGGQVRAQRFDDQHEEVGSSILVSQGPGQHSDPSVTGMPDGSFVVAWESGSGDGSGTGVWARGFGPDGTPHGNRTRVSEETHGDQSGIRIEADGLGNVRAVFADESASGGDTSGSGIRLAEFNARTDFGAVIQGNEIGADDGFGISHPEFSGGVRVAAGDVNGDGDADLIVTLPSATVDGNSQHGLAYVVDNPGSWGGGINLADLDPGGAGTIAGSRIDGFGEFAASGVQVAAGDLDADGVDDVVITSPGATVPPPYAAEGQGDFAGIVHGLRGERADLFPDSLASGALQGDGTTSLLGSEPFSDLGSALALVDPDYNGNANLAIGARGLSAGGVPRSGGVFVMSNNVSGNDPDGKLAETGKFEFGGDPFLMSEVDGTNGFLIAGEEAYDAAGSSLGAADFNGDGIEDLLIGAPFASPEGTDRDGAVYLVFGSTEPFPATLSLASLDGDNGVRFQGGGTRIGNFLDGLGDVNGDGFDDFIIGTPGARNALGQYTGGAFVVFGTGDPLGPTFDLADLDGSNGFFIEGVANYSNTGYGVAGAGDINGDGFDDIIVSGPNANAQDGAAYVIFGRAAPFGPTFSLANLDGLTGFTYLGGEDFGRAGSFVDGLGDVSGDGIDDFVVGDAGANAQVIYGRLPTGAVVRIGAGGGQTIHGSDLDDRLVGLGGDDHLIGYAGVDLLDGGDGADRLDGGAAVDRLLGGDGSDYLLGGALRDLLEGGAGNDVLNGGSDEDRMIGGLGNDTYFVDNAGDRAAEGAAAGTDLVRSSVTHFLSLNVENLILTGSAAINGLGNKLANVISGNNAANLLNGSAGADRMLGAGGNDTYRVDNAGDRVIESNPAGGADTVISAVNFTLGANVETLRLFGTGNRSGTGNDAANLIIGNSGGNLLEGRGGNDTLKGLQGNDRLDGGEGRDRLGGAAGNDFFRFDEPVGARHADLILDFTAAADTIELDRSSFRRLAANGAISAAEFRLGTAAADASDRIIYDSASGRIFYDPDGTGAVGALLFARVRAGTALTRLDFVAYGEPAGAAVPASAFADKDEAAVEFLSGRATFNHDASNFLADIA